MANFCPNCGKPVTPGAAFCASCGAKLDAAAPQQTTPQQPGYQYQQSQSYAPTGQGRFGVPAPGFSDRVRDPELLRAVKANKKAGFRFGGIFLLLPILGGAIYGVVGNEVTPTQGAIYGAGVSVFILVLMLYSSIKERASNSYDATVIDKYTRSGGDDDDEDEQITVVRTTQGRKLKLKDSTAWDYLPIGAQFRYHPSFAFPYELYDKTRLKTLYCPVCRKANPIENDRCSKCNAPLLK